MSEPRWQIVEERDGWFSIRPSTIPGAGLGLFAKVPLPKGARLEVRGVSITANSTADRCTRYADAYKFRVGRQLLIPLGYAALVNHSARPNLKKVVEGERVYL